MSFNTESKGQDANLNDLSGFNTKTKKLIKDNNTEEGNLIKNLFVTEDDNEVIKQFEQEKENEVTGELGD